MSGEVVANPILISQHWSMGGALAAAPFQSKVPNIVPRTSPTM